MTLSTLHSQMSKCFNYFCFCIIDLQIEQLQLRLQQEKSMRTMLERAMGRASSTLSPGHRHFAAQVLTLLVNAKSECYPSVFRQLLQFSFPFNVFSFNQTKELIAEIELLEEEVANREQHVLTLYRNIFENSVSRPPSEQNSSVASPAHRKHETRKHPSIISSAFCSSKKFPFRSLQPLVSIDSSGKRTAKTDHAPLSTNKTDFDFGKNCSGHTKVKTNLLLIFLFPILCFYIVIMFYTPEKHCNTF